VKNYLKNLNSLFSFFFQKEEFKSVVFYSEGINYKNYFIDIIKTLIEKYGIKITYVSSEEKDIIENSSVKNIFIGKGAIRTIFFSTLKCKNLILTLTDLDNLYLKKSKLCEKYIYLFHSGISTHRGYTKKAFWNYDIILCNGNYQLEELTEMEKIYNLRKKKLLKSGYPYLDYLKKKNDRKISNEIKHILIAPTWINDNNNLFEDFSIKIIETLVSNKYQVTLRPHPEHFRISRKIIESLNEKFSKFINFSIEKGINNLNSLIKSDLLITDYSGISLEYILGLKKPVIFINSSKKINNEEYAKVNLDSIENELRNSFGYQLNTNNLDNITKMIKVIETNGVPKKEEIDKFISKSFYNFGNSAEKIADEVSITSGYEYNVQNTIFAKSGKNKIKFDISKDNFAWITNNKIEKKMISVMKKGSRIMITGYNKSGSQTIDHYSLMGFTKAYNSAKKNCS